MLAILLKSVYVESWGPIHYNDVMSPVYYTKSHCGDNMVVSLAHLHNGISYTLILVQ